MKRRGSCVVAASGVALLAALAGCTREVRVEGLAKSTRIEGQESRLTGEPTGTWTWTYPNGAVRESGTFEDGRRVGWWAQWWSNGERRSYGRREWDPETKTSPREGPWEFWHQNGALSARGIYRRGLREGAWECSLDDGSLDGDRSGIYHDDHKIADG